MSIANNTFAMRIRRFKVCYFFDVRTSRSINHLISESKRIPKREESISVLKSGKEFDILVIGISIILHNYLLHYLRWWICWFWSCIGCCNTWFACCMFGKGRFWQRNIVTINPTFVGWIALFSSSICWYVRSCDCYIYCLFKSEFQLFSIMI